MTCNDASSFQKRDFHYHGSKFGSGSGSGSIIESKEQQTKMDEGTSHKNDNTDIANVNVDVKPSHSDDAKELKIELMSPRRSNSKFIFGHSTGHSGSTALHYGERQTATNN